MYSPATQSYLQPSSRRYAVPRSVFVCEFITGGGCCDQTLPLHLATEGDEMLSGLLNDFAAFPEIQVSTSRDARLPSLWTAAGVLSVANDVQSVWGTCLNDRGGTAWWIAPETDGILEHWVRWTARRGIRVLGCAPDTISVTADKLKSFHMLHVGGIATIPTADRIDDLPQTEAGWVVKPRDGAGCEATYRCTSRQQAQTLMHAGTIVQNYTLGVPASLSLLCANGKVRVLACNRQCVDVQNEMFQFRGVEANALEHMIGALEPLAQRIAALLPDLWGFVGVDLILTEDRGPLVVEINPRLTSAYPALRKCLGLNIVEQVMTLSEPNWWSEFSIPLALTAVGGQCGN